jgi:hypothetical protein
MKRWLYFILVVGILAASNTYAQQSGSRIDGRWNVKVSGHPGMSIVLEIKQDGRKLTGNFMIPDHGDLEMVGEFADGKIQLNSTENAFAQLSLVGNLSSDGSLAGNLTSTMGDMNWTATRAAGR